MKKQFNYDSNVIQDVIEFFEENYSQEISKQEVLEMEPEEVLHYYLVWNGVISWKFEVDIPRILQIKK